MTVHHGCGVKHRTLSGMKSCSKSVMHMKGGGLMDVWDSVKGVWMKAKSVYDHLKDKKYAKTIRGIPILGQLVDNIPGVGTAVKLAEDFGFGRGKR